MFVLVESGAQNGAFEAKGVVGLVELEVVVVHVVGREGTVRLLVEIQHSVAVRFEARDLVGRDEVVPNQLRPVLKGCACRHFV